MAFLRDFMDDIYTNKDYFENRIRVNDSNDADVLKYMIGIKDIQINKFFLMSSFGFDGIF